MTRSRAMLNGWPRQSAAAVSAGLLLLLISVWGVHVLFWHGSSTGLAVRHTVSEDQMPARQPPVYQMIDGQEVVYERPTGTPKGILALFHGCQHSAIDFWSRQPACASCIGLPEEKSIVKSAAARGYVSIAFSSMDREGSRCWDTAPPPTATPDVQKVLHSMDAIREAESWQNLPVYALGASSGGAFALLLPFHMQLQGIVVQIMGVPSQLWAEQLSGLTWPFPPAAFVHMPRDTRTAGVVADNIATLRKAGISTTELRIASTAVTPATLADAIEEVSMEVSQRIYKGLKAGNMLDQSDRLQHDPRATEEEWQALLRSEVEDVSALDSLEPDKSPIHEELNVLWAGHEIVASPTGRVLDWFEGQPQTDETAAGRR